VAIKTGRRPTAVILQDTYAIHRHWWNPFWEPDSVRDTEWTDWDYALIKAYQVIEDMTSGSSGQLMWLAQSARVHWDVEARTDFADAAVQREREKRGTPKPGEELFATNPHVAPGEEMPTMLEWLEDLQTGNLGRESNAPEGARPPTPAEVEEMRAARKKRLEEV